MPTAPNWNFGDVLDALDASGDAAWFQRNAAAFLRVCEQHGKVAAQHHDQLVAKFIAASCTTPYTPPCTVPAGLHASSVGVHFAVAQPAP